MRFLKRKYIVRRYSEPTIVRGYATIPYEDRVMWLDIQTTDRSATTQDNGTDSVQRIKGFCDSEILIEDPSRNQKGDRVFFQGRWFECVTCRLSDNTPLRHYTATFTECLDQDEPPEVTK